MVHFVPLDPPVRSDRNWRGTVTMKKRSERRKHCALAVVRRSQKFSALHRPVPGGAGRPKFNQLEMVTTFTYKPSLARIDASNFELSWYGNKPTHTHEHTHTQTHKQTHLQTGPITIHCAAKLRCTTTIPHVQCN